MPVTAQPTTPQLNSVCLYAAATSFRVVVPSDTGENLANAHNASELTAKIVGAVTMQTLWQSGDPGHEGTHEDYPPRRHTPLLRMKGTVMTPPKPPHERPSTRVFTRNLPVPRPPQMDARSHRPLQSDEVVHKEFAELGAQPTNGPTVPTGKARTERRGGLTTHTMKRKGK